ncbi:fibronectin type III domain-containing protein [Psychroserpens ponticola]|uniref:Fibronectin type III domain-containing protein n=1 Tax=Psychroserpens ponticola TaxID=2932268 RepID=A0ABY7RVB3_9FLAO|nr:fibronectin type III domain-containing protein [Psychroserpens ponticola]WCO01047.1 fibronectin type III domain-containing protein [Psychroserpens ponticola]
MKKFSFLFVFACLILACNNDDDIVDVCKKATNIVADNITQTTATITWDDRNNAASYIIEYGVSGFAIGSGTTLIESELTVDLQNLSPETTYDVYIQVVCSTDNLSMYSDIFSFTTSITPCYTVSNVTTSMITDTNVLISWEDDTNTVDSYELEYGPSGFSVGSGVSLFATETSIEITDLDPNTAYDIYVKAICSQGNESLNSLLISFTTLAIPVIPEFRPTLSELNLFVGDLGNLEITPYGFEYELSTKLFTDYAIKQRFIVLPNGEKLTYNGDGFPLFPDNTIIVKTFYYNNNETDLSQGTNIIETRVLIKINGSWELGNYKWNDSQTEATLDTAGATVPVTWVDADGASQSINYEIPSSTDCFTCHSNNFETVPIGPKLRTLNFNVNGSNQLQTLIDNEMLEGLTDPSTVGDLPDWEDTSLGLERRARAYMDINCAHCHIEGGYCENQSSLRLSYETAFGESSISENSNSILARIQNTIPQYGMPLIGTTILHDEGVSLMIDYINSLE